MRKYLGVVFEFERQVVLLDVLGDQLQAVPVQAITLHAVLETQLAQLGVGVGVGVVLKPLDNPPPVIPCLFSCLALRSDTRQSGPLIKMTRRRWTDAGSKAR